IIYNHFISAISQVVQVDSLLPITDIESADATSAYEYEPDEVAILKTLLPQYVESLIFGALLEAKASEHASRMTAMKSASENADELIDDLTISYDRGREAAVRQELADIVGGAEALEESVEWDVRRGSIEEEGSYTSYRSCCRRKIRRRKTS